VNICEFDHAVDPLCRPSLLGDFNVNPPGQRLSREVKSLFTIAFVAVIDASDRSRLSRERVAFVSTECLTGFVETDDWTGLVVGFVIEIEDILHVVDEISVLFWRNLSIGGEMWFQGVF